MKDQFGQEVVFGPRVVHDTRGRAAATKVVSEADASATALRLRIRQAASSEGAPRPRQVGLWILAVLAPVGASIIGALVFSIT